MAFLLAPLSELAFNMVKVTFEYMDAYSHGRWNKQQCIVTSVDEAIKIYGLGVDCDYHILSVEDLDKKNPPPDSTAGHN